MILLDIYHLGVPQGAHWLNSMKNLFVILVVPLLFAACTSPVEHQGGAQDHYSGTDSHTAMGPSGSDIHGGSLGSGGGADGTIGSGTAGPLPTSK
jgi:hypothetical protein